MKRKVIALVVVIVQMVTLTACASTPGFSNQDGIVIATEKRNVLDHSLAYTDIPSVTPMLISTTVAEENLEEENLEEENFENVMTADGQQIISEFESPVGSRLVINATVEVGEITKISKYDYVLVPISDELRQNLFAARFGERASEMEYDELNNVWTLSNSSSVADYYLFNTYYPKAGETVWGEESFSLEYRKIDLYPFDDNLLETATNSNVTLPLHEVISLCDRLVGAIANLEDYTVDYIHAYGTNGRRPYYKLVYKRVLDGMPVTGYNDLIILADSDGVEKIYGSIYDVEEVELQEPIITVEAAVAVLSNNIAQVSFGESEMLSIGKITLEYLVTQNIMGETSIIPVWRFWLGDTEDQMNLNRGKIFAVDAVTGELIQGERGHTF